MKEDRKISLVTGGSRGLGKDTASNIVKKEMGVMLTYNSKKEEGEKVVGEIEGMGRRAVALQFNTGDFGGGIIRDNKEVNAQVAANTAPGRAGLQEDIGWVIAFLCTEEARWINARRIEVSGGAYL
jgi:NAD(P)-dependent dehydrogenase (short-subunit alcohol dehydrogenase family)